MAMTDPFPQVAGQGIIKLVSGGVSIQAGIEDAAARRLNAPYLKLLAKRRPYVHAKWAMSLDGKIATRSGDSKWISNEASRARAHALRGRMDAVIVGIGTALADDPLLTARPPGPRTATRIVLDSGARLPEQGQLVRTAREAPVLVATGTPPVERACRLGEFGCEVLPLPPGADGRLSVAALLDELGRRRMTNVLVEGGAGVLGSFLDAGEVDEVHVFIAPRIIGGAAAKSPVGGAGIDRLADALRLTDWVVEEIAGDVYVRGWR
jgi:diaminohydroxyphosphoribosylaminopyrimidine deaminase/5-amino-6-(5-phosphoribosylamino)uracil reductase